jgi:hypothetical protein
MALVAILPDDIAPHRLGISMKIADYVFVGLILTAYFRLFDYRMSSMYPNQTSIVDMLANDPPESIIVHRLDWMSCIVKSAVVLLPVIAHFYGAEQRLVSLSGYIGLCLLLGPALPGGQSLYYIPSPEGIRHQMYPLRRSLQNQR